jgi:cytoskeletal protein RodZ
MSLASSPIVPFVTAGLAGALIIGTSYGGNSEDEEESAETTSSESTTDSTAAAPTDTTATDTTATAPDTTATTPTDTTAATAPAKATAKCAAGSCTVTFPKAGGTATVFGKPMVMKTGFPAGLSYTYGGVAGSASTKKVGKAGAYKVSVTKVDANGYTLTVAK